MSRHSNVMIRANIDPDSGAISHFELMNYSGGGGFKLRICRFTAVQTYWVVDGHENGRSMIYAWASSHLWDCHDLDDLAASVLFDYRADRIEDRDQCNRLSIEKSFRISLPAVLPADCSALLQILEDVE